MIKLNECRSFAVERVTQADCQGNPARPIGPIDDQIEIECIACIAMGDDRVSPGKNKWQIPGASSIHNGGNRIHISFASAASTASTLTEAMQRSNSSRVP